MKKKENEFDTSFLNDIQEFDDINSNDVFSFDSSMDQSDNEEDVTNSSLLSNDDSKSENVDFEFPTDFSFEDTLNTTPLVNSNEEENKLDEALDNKSDEKEESVSNDDFTFPSDFSFENAAYTAEEKVEEPSPDLNNDKEDDEFKSFDDIDSDVEENNNSKLSFEPIPGIANDGNNEEKTIEENMSSSEDTDKSIPFITPEEIVAANNESVESNETVDITNSTTEDVGDSDKEDNISLSQDEDFESKLEDLEKNTDFDKTDIDVDTDINSLFVKVNSNVKEASDIFLKNVEMKKKIDERFNELKQLQASVEESKRHDYDEINEYKDKVIKELMEKKEEVEERLNTLKEMQSSFEKEKDEFEDYKRDENIKIEDTRREAEASFESHKEELEKLEEKLRKQKTALEEERRQLSLDQIQYESDKNELANNMLKFNEIVGTFTNGMDKLS